MRVRFAPSPTGYLHLGGLRTALFNYLLARNTGGTFVLRIEDTDQSRSVPGALEDLCNTLEWLGIKWDEGPGKTSAVQTEYIQSKRLGIYRQYSEYLISKRIAYRCYCPKPQELSHHQMHDRRCRESQAPQSGAHVVRLASNEHEHVSFNDANYGFIDNSKPVDDVILMKSDGFPTYHFASVVDDHEMAIDMVMRGQEWLPSTAIHVALYKAFQWSPPLFCHLPLLLNPDRTKLSKRSDASRVEWYRQSGFFPAALSNFVSFLGWTPSVHYGNREILSTEELIRAFSFRDLNKSDSIVDFEKLKWFNRKYFEAEDSVQLVDSLKSKIKTPPSDVALHRIVDMMRGRASTVNQIVEECPYLFKDPEPANCATEEFDTLHCELATLDDFSEDRIKQILSDSCQKAHLMTLRMIMTGACSGPPLVSILALLGKETVMRRLEAAIQTTCTK